MTGGPPASPDLGEVASSRGRAGGRGDTDFLSQLFRSPLDPGYLAAAARRGGRPPQRRWTGRVLTLVTLLVVGALLAVAYRQVVHEEPSRSQVRAELVEQIHAQDDTTTVLAQRAEELRDEVTRLRDEQLTGSQARELRDLAATTGLARVTGDGVVVQVADGAEQLDPVTGDPVPESRILDYDLQRIANSLWAAGAEAIAINDRRLTSTSTIRSASGAILVNRRPVTGPYEVVAIGADDMDERFNQSTTGRYLQDLVAAYGIDHEVRSESDLTLPGTVAPDLRHAAPADTAASPGGD